jgi:hypothetical protein
LLSFHLRLRLGVTMQPRTHRTSQVARLAILLALATGCATGPGRESRHEAATNAAIQNSVQLAAPQRGFQVQTVGALVEPGEDLRTCEVIALPGTPDETFYVNRIEAALSAHGEDLVVSAAIAGSDTEAIMDVGASVPCVRAGEAFGEALLDVTAAPARYRDQRLPDGVGKVFHGGQKLAVEHHFVNEGSEPVPALVKLSFHTVDASAVRHLAHTARFSNFTIYTPPGGESSHLGECAVDSDVHVSDLVRRTQRYGTTFAVWRLGGERDGELIWQSESRADSEHLLTEDPLRLSAGEGFRFQCDYDNTTDRELRYGVAATDETCALDATFWSETELDTEQGCMLFGVGEDGIARK